MWSVRGLKLKLVRFGRSERKRPKTKKKMKIGCTCEIVGIHLNHDREHVTKSLWLQDCQKTPKW